MDEVDACAAALSSLLGITEYTQPTIPLDTPSVEIKDMGQVLQELSKKSSGRKRRKAQKKEMKRKEEAERQKMGIEKALRDIIYAGDKVKIHRVKKSMDTLTAAQQIELDTNAPLSFNDANFQKLQTTWISKPGIHLGIDDGDQVVFAVRITPWKGMGSEERKATQAHLQTLMDWSSCVNDIKNNGAAKGPRGPHGDRKVNAPSGPMQSYGIMAGVGWHRSYEKGTDVSFYTPKPGKEAMYTACLDKLSGIAQEYRDRLFTLLPHVGRQMVSVSREGHIPSFATTSLDEGTSPEYPFANSLTLTHNDFANYLHKDRDHIPIAYGMWWVSMRERTRGPFHFDSKADQYRIPGGAFLWGEYNIGVNFSKASGLVEIFWRGQKDFHCTMQSQSPDHMTRWGTSVQLTGAGVSAIGRFNAKGDPTRARNAGEKPKALATASKKRQRATTGVE